MSQAVTTTYISADDEEITLKSLLISPGKDNLQSIYARPLSLYLESLIEKEHVFSIAKYSDGDATFDLDELRAQTQKTSALLEKSNADGLVHLQVSKGQMGLRFEMALFTKKSGQVWAYADLLEKDHFDLEHARESVQTLLHQILGQIPYQGLVLSRTGGRITINQGANGGVKPDQEIDVIQVVGVTRHPQFQFVTHVQKEIIGKLRITKVDEWLSFGYILFEKEPQVIQPNLKLLIRDPIFYPNLATSKNESVVKHLLSRGDGRVIMQKDAAEWIPEDNPTFGRMHLLLGMGQFGASTNIASAGGQQGSTLLALNAQVDADLWITRSWFLRLDFTQGSAQLANPLSDSSPAKLNFSLIGLKGAIGYDFLISNSIYGSRIQALLGYSQFSAATTDSTPTSFTSSIFSGIGVGLSGYTPWDEYESKWGFGAELWYHLYPSVSETPVTSGSPQNTNIVELSGAGYYHWRPNLYWVTKVSLNSLNTSFSGTGTRTNGTASSSDYSWTRINAGVEHLF